MLEACICPEVVVSVTNCEALYGKYFGQDVGGELWDETKSARLHSIDTGDIIGMFGAMQAEALNASLCYLSWKMRSRKNRLFIITLMGCAWKGGVWC